MHEDIIEKLYHEYTVHGFISEEYIFDELEKNSVSLFDVENICDQLLSRGAIIRNSDRIQYEEDVYDRSNIDYEKVFREVLEIDDSFFDFIEYIRGIQAPQHREWQNLMPQAKRNNMYARKRLFDMYIKVAVRIALGYAKRYKLPLDETIQSALIGLHVSIDKYDIMRQDNFSTYFPLWIRQYIIRDAQTRNPLMYFPTHMKERLFAIYDNIDAYYGYTSVTSMPEEELISSISTELECSSGEARKLFNYLIPFESIDGLLENEDNEILFSDYGRVKDKMDDKIEYDLNCEVLYLRLGLLTSREEEVLKQRYGIGCERAHTLEEVGHMFNVTRERIRQIEEKALRNLRRIYSKNEW